MRTLVIIPAYNEQDSIVAVVNSVVESGFDYLVVNDGSTDNTAAICKANNFTMLNLPVNLGIGGAVQAGHLYALRHGYDIDVQFDGDGQHPAAHIQALVDKVGSGADLVVGSRFLADTGGYKSTLARRIGIRWLSALIKMCGGGRVTDATSGFRACNHRAITLFSDNYPIDYPEPESIVLAAKKGLVIKELPVEMHERMGGKSSINAFASLYYMIKVSLAIILLGFLRKSKKG
jgi:glycosyltransferase involved in cell wall biosynthesis